MQGSSLGVGPEGVGLCCGPGLLLRRGSLSLPRLCGSWAPQGAGFCLGGPEVQWKWVKGSERNEMGEKLRETLV